MSGMDAGRATACLSRTISAIKHYSTCQHLHSSEAARLASLAGLPAAELGHAPAPALDWHRDDFED